MSWIRGLIANVPPRLFGEDSSNLALRQPTSIAPTVSIVDAKDGTSNNKNNNIVAGKENVSGAAVPTTT